jgi:hypothetical protein
METTTWKAGETIKCKILEKETTITTITTTISNNNSNQERIQLQCITSL